MISAKTMTDKIDLFIKIADDDGNGELSYEEIHRLCMLCLQKYIQVDDEGFVKVIGNYFAKLIFQVCEIDQKDEIPVERIKQLIRDVPFII